jgi:prepilin-type N-terminal cleavage/methylation domain-containing protein
MKLCYNYLMIFKKGFTLIEILLVVGIAIIIFFLSAPFGLNFYRTQILNETQSDVVSALQTARHNSILQKNDSPFGVHFETDSYTIFQGSTYASRDTTQDQVFNLTGDIEISGPDADNEILFSKLTGGTTDTGTTTITYGELSKEILVTDIGLISKVD